MPKGDPPPQRPPITHSAKAVTEVRILKDASTIDPTWLGQLVLTQLTKEKPVVVGIVEKL